MTEHRYGETPYNFRIETARRLGVLSERQKELLQQSWSLILPAKDRVADLFYQRLFELQPSYRSLFRDTRAQKRKLFAMLSFIIKAVHWHQEENVPSDEDPFFVVLALAQRHAELYRVPDEAYPFVGEALLWALSRGLGEAFTDEMRGSWKQIYELLFKTMKMGQTASVQRNSDVL